MARVLRFQMATAIPPNAAEVAIKRPERQKFRRSGGGIPVWSLGLAAVEPDLNEICVAAWMTWKKVGKESRTETYFSRTASMLGKGELSQKIQELGFKNLRNMFFNEIRHLQLEVHCMHLLI